jgi:hypothetical protein
MLSEEKQQTLLEADMPGSEMALMPEILEPRRLLRSQSIRCDCCRELRAADEFEPDSCGICIPCLECDDLLIDMDECTASARPA